MAQADAPGVFQTLYQTALAAAAGALTVIVAWRTRLANADNRVARLEETLTTELRLVRRQQFLTLEICADMARKLGIENRFNDQLIRFISEHGSESDRVDRRTPADLRSPQ